MINEECTRCHGEGVIHSGGLALLSAGSSLLMKDIPCDCVKVAIEHIITLETLPHQIDYTLPFRVKAQQAQEFINSLPMEEKDKANKEIEKRVSVYFESGAAYYDSLF